MHWRLGIIRAHDRGEVEVHSGRDRIVGRPQPPLHLRCIGWLVLIDTSHAPFSTVRVLQRSPTPSPRIPPVERLRASVQTHWGPAQLHIATAGEWCVDSLGRPCELGRVRHLSGGPEDLGPWVGLVNYTGHRLADLCLRQVIAHHTRVDGEPWLVLTDVPPDAADEPEPPAP